MKTAMRILALVGAVAQMFAGVCGLFSLVFPVFGLTVAIICTLFGIVNLVVGINNTMESLFGDDGLICPIFGKAGSH
jgi:hypothetical protein